MRDIRGKVRCETSEGKCSDGKGSAGHPKQNKHQKPRCVQPQAQDTQQGGEEMGKSDGKSSRRSRTVELSAESLNDDNFSVHELVERLAVSSWHCTLPHHGYSRLV